MKNLMIGFVLLIVKTILAQEFWQHTNGPIRYWGTLIQAIRVSPDGVIFVGGLLDGVFRSTDEGVTWQQINTVRDVRALIINSKGHLYAGATSVGIYRSTDNGDTWIQSGLNNIHVFSLITNSEDHLIAGTAIGVYRSTDEGNNWTYLGANDEISSLAIDSNNHIFAGAHNGHGVFRSLDSGNSWEQVNNGLNNTYVQVLSIDNDRNVFAGTLDGIYISSDDGNNWTQFGLQGKAVNDVAINSAGDIFAATSDFGIYRSSDSGNSWLQINNGLIDSGRINSISAWSISVTANDQLFVGTWNCVAKSTDNGNTWKPIGFRDLAHVFSLVSSSSGETYAGTYQGVFRYNSSGNEWIYLGLTGEIRSLAVNSIGHLFAGTWNLRGVYRSTDQGDTWMQINQGLPNQRINSIILNSSNHIFAGTDFGVYRSTNNGDNWSRTGLAFPVYALAIDSAGHLLAGTETGTTEGAVFRSTDNGSNWIRLPLAGYVTALAIHPNGYFFAGIAQTVYNQAGGIYRSTDNGISWQRVGVTYDGITSIISQNNHIFAGTWNGVDYSADNGDTWTKMNKGLSEGSIWDISIDSNGYVFAGTSRGVYRSVQSITSVRNTENDIPVSFALRQNYPNPFNTSTTIQFSLPRGSFVTLKLYNPMGEEVATLASGNFPAGIHKVEWNASDIASGVYLYRLQAGSDLVQAKKLVMVK